MAAAAAQNAYQEADLKTASEADFLMKEAAKKLGGFTPFGFGKAQKQEEAADLYVKAATKYKIAKKGQQSGDAYLKAAELYEKLENEIDATKYYTEAAKCYRPVNPALAKQWYDRAITKQQEGGKWSQAAKLLKELAELEEQEGKLPEAIEAYERAADCFGHADAATSKNQCLLKVADFSAQIGDHKRAIDLYEAISRESADNQLLKWSVTGYLFKALLCQFVVSAKSGISCDEMNAKMAQYLQLYPPFERQREFAFLKQAVAAFEAKDMDAFNDAVHEFDHIAPLDNWKAVLLLEVKKCLKAAPLNALNDDGSAADASGLND